MKQEQVSARRSSLSMGESLLAKGGMTGKMRMICVGLPFEQMRSIVSFPIKPGKHQRIAGKMIDFRGNEVVRVVKLQTGDIPYAYS
jgi:hypothetical protein